MKIGYGGREDNSVMLAMIYKVVAFGHLWIINNGRVVITIY